MANETSIETEEKGRGLTFFERYLTLWVILCIGLGTLIGWGLPGFAEAIDYEVRDVNVPIAILLFLMIYPIMVQIEFSEIVNATKRPKPVLLTLIVNWAIKPFTMAFWAWLFMVHIWSPWLEVDVAYGYMGGMILLGIAPCTAMVLVWSYLAEGNMGYTLIMVAINSLSMLFLYAPLGVLLLGLVGVPGVVEMVSGVGEAIPLGYLAFSVGVYIGLPLVAGYITRHSLISLKSRQWFEEVFLPKLDNVATVSLLLTLTFIFTLEAEEIVRLPLNILMIAIPLLIQTFSIFIIAYLAAKLLGIVYEDAAPAAMIGASNHFEVALAVAIMLFGAGSPAALAAVVGVLIEVPAMLFLVKICRGTRGFFESNPELAVSS